MAGLNAKTLKKLDFQERIPLEIEKQGRANFMSKLRNTFQSLDEDLTTNDFPPGLVEAGAGAYDDEDLTGVDITEAGIGYFEVTPR